MKKIIKNSIRQIEQTGHYSMQIPFSGITLIFGPAVKIEEHETGLTIEGATGASVEFYFHPDGTVGQTFINL